MHGHDEGWLAISIVIRDAMLLYSMSISPLKQYSEI